MSKRALYFIIIVLVGALLYLLFVPEQSVEAPTVTTQPLPETDTAVESVVNEDAAPIATPAKTASIEFNGTLIGFADGKDEILGSYKYALINDGIEVLRIDLRPLVGYDVTNLESDLGVSVGSAVTVLGNLEQGNFVVVAITSYE